MKPDKAKSHKAPRAEFEVAYYTKELGRPMQRKLLQQRLDDFSDSFISEAGHGDEAVRERGAAPPREDRAG
jgi:hypothetical protein